MIASRFDTAEAEVDRGEPWRFREPDAPNPLTIEAIDWSTGVTKLGHAEFLNGGDRNGKRWSVIVGSVVLTKRLIEGVIEEWDETSNSFVVTQTLGRVQPGEIVSIKYIGDKEGAKYAYPNFRVVRKPPETAAAEPQADTPEAKTDDDIPF
jgi:hypothetical protein